MLEPSERAEAREDPCAGQWCSSNWPAHGWRRWRQFHRLRQSSADRAANARAARASHPSNP